MRDISAQIKTMGPPKPCGFRCVSFGNMAIITIERPGAIDIVLSGDRNRLRDELIHLARSLEFRTVADQ